MTRAASQSGALALVIAAACGGGCGNGSLQGNADGGGQGGLPAAGRRSYTVSSNIASQGEPFSPAGHTFTLIVDADTQTVIAGGNGSGAVVAFVRASADTITTGPIAFDLSCDATVSYDSLSIAVGPDGKVTGTGIGHGVMLTGDVSHLVPATMSLSGLADTRPPALAGIGPADIVDPLTSLRLVATEPLPPAARPALVAASGAAAIALVPSPMDGGPAVNAFESPGTLLRYDERYVVQFAGTADFAGNLARMRDELQFTTRPAPPLIAEDGFESTTTATLGGAHVVTATDAPAISGGRSLYILPTTGGGLGGQTQVALRLVVAPGDSVLRFSYRFVNPSGFSNTRFAVASPGGTIQWTTPVPDSGITTTQAMFPSGQYPVGPVATAELPLPADATNEVVFARVVEGVTCGGLFPPPQAGLIIDDLRVE